MIKVLLTFVFIIAAALPGFANAGQVADLYQADVAAEGATEQWQRQALLQVLSRVSGRSDIAGMPQIEDELKRASGYIKQFEAVRHADGNRMRVVLDAAKINQLLQQNNISVWGALRPDILVWLVQQEGTDRTFVRRAELPLNKALNRAFRLSALPLLQPLYDMDDLQQLAETDVWAGFWQQINKASARYNADVVLAVTVDRITKEGESLYRLTWQRQDSGRTYRDEVKAADEAALMQTFASALSAQLAEQYASVMSAQNNAEILLEVQQLSSLADLVQVQKLLQQMVGVSDVTISRYEAGTAHYRILSRVGADGLMNALRFNPQLRLHSADSISINAAIDAALQPVLATFSFVRP